jgi:hypothetical protein
MTQQKKIEPPTEKDYELAKQAFAWMESLVDSKEAEGSDYLWNLSVYGKAGITNMRGLGIVASAITAYQREQAKKAERSELADSVYIGNLNGPKPERLTLFVKVIALISTQYGYMTKMTTMHEGKLCVVGCWGVPSHVSGHPRAGFNVQQGDELWVRGTVKRHSEYKGVKETMLNRADSCLDPTVEKAQKASVAKAKREEKKVRMAARKAFGEPKVIAEYGHVIDNPNAIDNGVRYVNDRLVQLAETEVVAERKTNQADEAFAAYRTFDLPPAEAIERYEGSFPWGKPCRV